MKQILCLFILVIYFFSIGKAENFEHGFSTSIESFAAPNFDLDTFYLDVEVGSTTVICPDTIGIIPVGSLSILNCALDGNKGLVTPISGSSCLSYQINSLTGLDTICVEVCNSFVPTDCDTSIFIINIEFPPPPIPVDDNYTVMENDSLDNMDILLNDTIFSSNFSLSIVTPPANGTVTVDPATNFVSYVPNTDFCGIDTFEYWLCSGGGACPQGTVTVDVICSDEKEFFIYNSFSPNLDGINDYMAIDGLEKKPDNKLFIYNRWGILVYSASPYENDWDGKWNGEDLPDGTYYYIFDDGISEISKGYVQIYR